MKTIRTFVAGLALLVAFVALALPARAAEWVARHGLTSADYQAAFDQYGQQGFRLISVSGYESGGALRYAALWKKVQGPAWVARHGMTPAQYQQAFDDYGAQGYRLVYIDGYNSGGQVLFAAIWEQRQGPAWVAKHGLSGSDYQATFDDLTGKGYRLIGVSGYADGGQARYAAIFEQSPGPAWAAKHGLSGAQYQQAFNELGGQGYKVKLVSGYRVGGTDYYAAIWEKSSGEYWQARHGIPDKFYQSVFDNYYYQGYEPDFIGAFTSDNGGRLNGIWHNAVFASKDLDLIYGKVDAYMKKHSVPGLSIAVTQGERLVYAAGFGLADKDSGEPVGPMTRFRVASVSKPFTSAAIMKLVEANSLGLDDKVFGPNSILGANYPTPKSNPDIEKITVRHLLGHVAGFTTTTSDGDPMFNYTGTTQSGLISWWLGKQALATTPGTQWEYSNFGYCLLGRIIEAKTGKTYEQYVKDAVLKPSGITAMEIGGDTKADRKPGEVVYYGGSPYSSVKPTRFDSHGGWIATPSDLLRFLVRVDGNNNKPDIITAADHTTMTTALGIKDANGKDPQYAFGWGVSGGTQNHNGTMSGTIAWLLRGPGDLAYAAVSNGDDDWFGPDMMALMNDITGGVSAWPAYDLMGAAPGAPLAYKLGPAGAFKVKALTGVLAVERQATMKPAKPLLKSKVLATDAAIADQPAATTGKLLKLQGAGAAAGADTAVTTQPATTTKLLKSPGLAATGTAATATVTQDTQTAALPPTQRFKPPKGPHGLPLLACLTADGQQCGAPAALAFCQAQGYAHAGAFNTDKQKGSFETLGGQPCTESRCKIFIDLTCTN
jgi:CubicO group peptidase (beta-lactamase class C family)